MKVAKAVIVHIISAAITGYLALRVIGYGQLYERLLKNEFYEPLLWTGLFLVAIAYFIAIWLVDWIINYIWFRLSDVYHVCGLYVEAFLDDASRSNLSLLVLHYDVPREELKITGYAFRPHETDKTKLVPWASWESRALHHTLFRDYTDIFYIHEGDVGPTAHVKVRGTTICKLPTSRRFFQSGSFCDWKDINQADLRPLQFEVIKADDTSQKMFFDGIKSLRSRPWCLLRLAAPTQEYFFSFASAYGAELLAPGSGADRGPMMLGVWGALNSKASPGSVIAPAAATGSQKIADIPTTGNDKIIRDRLTALLPNCFARYSNFNVAAAVEDENANVYYGVNVENQSFSVSTCAEAGAIASMHLAGGKKIKRLYLISDPNIAVVPCGACRQRLAEFGSTDTQITTFRKDGHQSTFRLLELFPHGFQFK
jgi:cytidine deaminase